MQFGNFRSHGSAQLSIEVGQRFVEKEHFGFAHDGTPEGDTLTLTAGKRLGFTGKIIGDAEDFRRGLYLLIDDFLRDLSQLQAERHIVVYGHVGIKRVVLENHGDISVLGNDVVHKLAVDVQFARRNFFETCNHTKRGRFTAAGRTDEYDKFFIADIEAEIEYCLNAGRIDFVNSF